MSEKKKILVLDDEADVRTYLKALLEDNGYEVETGADGNEGAAKLSEFEPDLITLDISMPEKSGIRFYRDLKADEKFSSVPVVVVTGVTGLGGDPDEFRKFLETRKQVPPPEGFVAKPIDKDELLGKIAELLS